MILPQNTTRDIFSPKGVFKHQILLDNLIATRTLEKKLYLLDLEKYISIKLTSTTNFNLMESKKIGMKLWGKPAVLMLSHWPIQGKLQEYITEKELEKVPQDLALITISTAYASLIKTISSKLESHLEILTFSSSNKMSFNKNNRKPRQTFIVNFTIKIDNEPEVFACLKVGSNILYNIIHLIKKIPSVPHLSSHNASVPVYIEYGSSYCSQSIIRNIESEDILMIDSIVDRDRDNTHLRFLSNQVFLANNQDGLGTYHFLEEINMENKSGKELPINDIPLHITFDLGKTSIKLNELEKIGVGYTINIGRKVSDLVTLRIENKTIGYGELVQVGDRVGVRVTKLTPKD